MSTERHEQLVEWLDAYLDGELDAPRAALLSAHILNCARCARVLAISQRLRHELLQTPSFPEPTGAAARIHNTILQGSRTGTPHRWFAWSGWGTAALVATAWFLWPWATDLRRTATPPMVVMAARDFTQHLGNPLPQPNLVALQSRVPFPVTPLPQLQHHILSSWRTKIRGQPAAAIAYRVANQMVVEYFVSEPLFFRQAAVRRAVARSGHFLAYRHGLSIVAWPAAHSGILLIGSLTPQRLAAYQNPSPPSSL